RGEDHRARLAGQVQLLVVVLAHRGEELGLLDGGLPHVALAFGGGRGVVVLLRGDGGAAGGAREVYVLLGLAVLTAAQQPAVVAGDAHGQEQGGGHQADLLGDLVQQLQRCPARTVPLVDHRDDGQPVV